MADIREIAGRTGIHVFNGWVWIIDGLNPGERYRLWEKTSDALHRVPPVTGDFFYLACEDAHSSLGNTHFEGNALGAALMGGTDIVATSYDEIVVYADEANGVKSSGDCQPPPDNRLSGSFGFAILAGYIPETPYAEADDIAATPGNGEALIEWTAGSSIVVEPGDLVYQLWRRPGTTGTPIGVDLVMDWSTDLSFLDTGLTNDVTYRYAVMAGFRLDAAPDTPVGGSNAVVNTTPTGVLNAVSFDGVKYRIGG